MNATARNAEYLSQKWVGMMMLIISGNLMNILWLFFFASNDATTVAGA